ncbi:SDR family oxidoreductase [Viridibacillus sp. YIM B01967]|uniref:SDR family oxidoreductase n=1 Tax=Viridibacillus soli TaxID=2798301 RepID=A0ABS1H4U5_9BACL|nr:SDR family oxidoreductase [Viridibacillus soli]MBK3494324.1 SDR family oxidoreductase [Viridibacillus soli]
MKRFCLVLGASGVIGCAISEQLAQDGWSLYMQYNQGAGVASELINKLTASYPEQEFMTIQADLTAPSAAEQIAGSIFSLQAIVVASGQALYKLVDDTSADEMDALWKVHVQTPIRLISLLASKLRHNEISHITMIGSIWGEAGASGEALYATVKGALHAFVKSYAQEAAGNGILVNAVAPGFINTKMNGHLSDLEEQALIAEIPLARAGSPTEVGDLVSFLLSGRANYITGQILRINGGWYI